MRGRFLVALLGLAVAAAFLARDSGPGASARAPRGSAPAAVQPPAPPADPAEWASVPSRNVFEYADEPKPDPLPSRPAPTALAPAPSLVDPQPGLPFRLIGLVRQGGKLQAAVQMGGEVLVVGPGGELAGYEVLGVDEDSGLRLRAPDGLELTLPPPAS